MLTASQTMKRSVLLAALVGSAIAATAGAAPTFQANIPDFYQHQKAWTAGPLPPVGPNYTVIGNDWWESNGGWCGTTAWTNVLYHWSQNGYSRLWDHSNLDPQVGPPYHGGRNWLERAIYMNEDLALRVNPVSGSCAWVPAVRNYVQHWTGVDPQIERYLWLNGQVERLTSAEANGDAGAAGVASGHADMWDVFTTYMNQGMTCTVRIGTGNDLTLWWAGSFHVLAGAGFEQAMNGDRFLYLADPNDTSGVTNAGANWGHQYTVAEGGGAIPMGAAHYVRVKLAADGRTIDGGTFDGCPIDAIYTMRVPTPGALSLAAMAGLACFRRRR